jgi:4-diphosphocytidyl-2-C-methyl-D-erythritol kinase
VYQAIELLRRQIRDRRRRELELPGIEARIDKRIPAAAGLGGASSNAAGALIGLNHLWNGGLELTSLQRLGAVLGSDVPFFLTGGSAICGGRGEQVRVLECPANVPVVIVKPPIGLSTGDVYRKCTLPANPMSSSRISEQMSTGRIGAIGKQLFNRLESIAAGMTDWIDRLKSSFSVLNCLGHQMTGSGSSYFGLFSNQIAALRAAACLSNQHPDAKIFVCETLGRVQPASYLLSD